MDLLIASIYKIREIERKLKNLKKTTGGSNISQEISIKSAKKMKTLQSRLSHALKRYNEILGSNTGNIWLSMVLDCVSFERGDRHSAYGESAIRFDVQEA